MQNILIRRHANSHLRTGVSLLALAVGMVIAEPRLADAASCGSGAGTTISAACTGPFTWTGGNLSNSAIISGGPTGVGTNSGTLGILTNSGTISGGQAGLLNSGTLGTLTNSGTISGGTMGGSSSLFVGTMTNSGIITGAEGFDFVGTLGSLVNTGTIQGTANSGLGFSDGTYGTIQNGAFGTISGATKGLSFQAGCGVINVTKIDNAGKIWGGTTGIQVSYSNISTLTNSGTVGGGNTAISISVFSTLSTLTNSGTISGGNYAINNSGSLGPITNSGAINGNIQNVSSNNLTINGGSGAVYGTLTGGMITNTNSNLVFASGNILLEDNVNVGGNRLSNTGATIKLTSTTIPTITGSYSQTGGGLVIVTANSGSTYGYLSVTGNATVTGSTITISGSGLSSGEKFTIVHSGSTGSYTGDTGTVSGTSGLVASISTVGEDLVVTLASGGGYYQKGATTGSTGGQMGHALDQIAAATSPTALTFQNTVLAAINALPVASQGQAIKQLAPVQNAPSAQMSSNAATAVLGAVEQHQQTAMAYDPTTGTAAGSETHDSALWGQMLGGGVVRGGNAEADGYKTTDFGLATGFDHRFTDNAMGGVAASWLRALSSGADDSAGSTSTLDSYQLTLYGTYRQGPAFIDSQIGVGYNSFSQTRAVPFLGSRASASYGGEQYLARALTGYDIPTDVAMVTPLAGLTWLRAVNDAYDENGAGSADLSIDRRGSNSLTQELGGKLSWTLDTRLGTVKPELRAEWLHDYLRGPIATSGLMGGETFASTAPRTAPDGVQLGLAATLNSDDNLSFRAEYQGEARTKYQSHTGLVKAVWGF